MELRRFLTPPHREFALIALLALALIFEFTLPGCTPILGAIAALGALPTVIAAIAPLRKGKIGIDAFNVFAVVISFATREIRSAAFIALMLSFARLLEWRTESKTHDAIEELLKLKPLNAVRERDGELEEVHIDAVEVKDILLVKSGARVPVDGTIVLGASHLNESSVTGESALVQKTVGDRVLSGTLVESGTIKVRATAVGADSTLERMAALMQQAAQNKSRSEKMADRFAGMFLPFVAVLGLVTFLVTRNIKMTASIFLVACADDMAVAIPLAMTASLGIAAKRGVIVKGGEWFDALRRIRTLILDKTGTLTFGTLAVKDIHPEPWISEEDLLRIIGSAEKFSEHPVGHAAYRAAADRFGHLPDPDTFTVLKGSGVRACIGTRDVVIGNERILDDLHMTISEDAWSKFRAEKDEHGQTTFLIIVDGRFAGLVTLADIPRPEAADALRDLKSAGIGRIIMLTGDNERTAAEVCRTLGIDEYRASMTPEGKLREIEALSDHGSVGMVGDGINDAPALARADVGIAMGGGGTAVAVEAADVVILTDDLSRLPEMIRLGHRTMTVIRNDVIIWVVSNLFGFILVFTGFLGPALAAAYNFLTDFLPIINSSILFRAERPRRDAPPLP